MQVKDEMYGTVGIARSTTARFRLLCWAQGLSEVDGTLILAVKVEKSQVYMKLTITNLKAWLHCPTVVSGKLTQSLVKQLDLSVLKILLWLQNFSPLKFSLLFLFF